MYTSPAQHLLAELVRLDLMLLRFLGQRRRPGARRDPRVMTEEEIRPLLELEQEEAAAEAGGDVDEWLRVQGEGIRRSVHQSLRAGMRLPLVEACLNLGLDAESVGILLLAVAPHVHPKYDKVYAYLQELPGAAAPRVDFALRLFGSGEEARLGLRRRFAEAAPLLSSGLIELGGEGPAGRTDLSRPILADPRLVRFLLDEPGATPVVEACRAEGTLPTPTRSLREAMVAFGRLWRPREGPEAVAILAAEDGAAALKGAEELAAQRGREALLVDLASPCARRFPLDARIKGIIAEARLTGALLAVAGLDALSDAERAEAMGLMESALTGFAGAACIITQARWPLHAASRARPVIRLAVAGPDQSEREDIWRQALGEGAEAAAVSKLASAFRLGAGQIADAARMARINARVQAEGEDPPPLPLLLEASRQQSRAELGKLAQPLPARGGWDRLVLPARSVGQMQELIRFHRHRERVFDTWGFGEKVLDAKGIVALFAGPPGTGKTLAASLIAGELGLQIYRIDLAEVVSKYIGETEKNLDRVFQAATNSSALLLFNEADALFGKRTEVKDAHDRYANIETSYLLQKVESFEGVTVLTTNLKRNMDEAFLRRISIVAEFPHPGPRDRRRLWETLIPKAMPVETGVDLDFLAERFELSGGYIKNAIQSAALLAADADEPVSFGGLLLGVYRELQKQGKMPGRREFGPHYGRLTATLERERGEAGEEPAGVS